MADCRIPRGRRALALVAVGLLLGVGAPGCGGKSEPQNQSGGEQKADASTSTAEQQAKAATNPQATVDPRWTQSFQEATRDVPPTQSERPPDTTITGKSVGQLYVEVRRAWDSIRLVNDEGRPLLIPVTLDTDLGPIEMELHTAWAPNHVRSFLALAQAGYYDGLVFERCIHQASENPAIPDFAAIEAGCPLGTGDLGRGSIGYWLRSEFNPRIKHEEGIVCACHANEEDSGDCKFFISLCKAPGLDQDEESTVFGKVTQGLDVARKIWEEGIKGGGDDDGSVPPARPVVIRKVIVHAGEVDKQAAEADNKKQ